MATVRSYTNVFGPTASKPRDAVRDGRTNPLIDRITSDPDFGLTSAEVAEVMEPKRFVGRSPEQVDEFLAEHVTPALSGIETVEAPAPRV